MSIRMPLYSWVQIWPHLHWKLILELLGSQHYTFSDLPLLAELVFGDPVPSPVVEELGSILGARVLEVITHYVVAFLKTVLECQPSELLQRPAALYPEIVFTNLDAGSVLEG